MNKIIEIVHACQTNRNEAALRRIARVVADLAVHDASVAEVDEAIAQLGIEVEEDAMKDDKQAALGEGIARLIG